MNRTCYKCNLLIKEPLIWYGLHRDCFKEWFKLSELEEFKDLVLQEQKKSGDIVIGGTSHDSFFHGMFRKYSSSLSGIKYILKIEEKEYPELPAMEYLCNQIFQTLGIKIPPFYLINFEGYSCFVSENFMQHYCEANLVHIYRYFPLESIYNCENILKILQDKIKNICAKEEMVFLILADSLIGNHDRHGRNIALIESIKGFFMSPIYDNVSYLGTESDFMLTADLQPKGKIATISSSEPSMKDYVIEFNKLGYGYVVDEFRKALSLENIRKLIYESQLTPKRRDALYKIIVNRSKEL